MGDIEDHTTISFADPVVGREQDAETSHQHPRENFARAGSQVTSVVHIRHSRKAKSIGHFLEPPINLEEPLCTGVFELHADALTKAVKWLCSVVHEHQSSIVDVDNALGHLQEDVKVAQQLIESNHTFVVEKVDRIMDESNELKGRTQRSIMRSATGTWAAASLSPCSMTSPLASHSGVATSLSSAVDQETNVTEAPQSPPSIEEKFSLSVMGLAKQFIEKTRERAERRFLEDLDGDVSPMPATDETAEHETLEYEAGLKLRKSLLRKNSEVAEIDSIEDLKANLPVAVLALFETTHALQAQLGDQGHSGGNADTTHVLRAVKRDLEGHKRWQRKIEQQLEHQERTQQQKDLAQDELLQMELNSLRQAIQSRMSVADFEKAREAVLARSEENTQGCLEKLKAELHESLDTVHEQADGINKAITKQIDLLEQQMAENVKRDSEREEEVNKELAAIRDDIVGQLKEENSRLLNRVGDMEKQLQKTQRLSKSQAKTLSDLEEAGRGSVLIPESRKASRDNTVDMTEMQAEFAAQMKALQEQFSQQIADMKTAVESVAGQRIGSVSLDQPPSRGDVDAKASTKGTSEKPDSAPQKPPSPSQNSLRSTPQGSRAATASTKGVNTRRSTRSRDGGMERQSPDNLSWLAEKMERFANADKEREKSLLDTMQKLLPELEQLPERVTKLYEEVEQLTESSKELMDCTKQLPGANDRVLYEEDGTGFSPVNSRRTSRTPVAVSRGMTAGSRGMTAGSKPATAATSNIEVLPMRLTGLLEGSNNSESPPECGVDVYEELERFRRLFEYLESVVPKDAQKAMQFFLGKEWRSGEQQAVRSGGDVENESRLETKLQLTEDSMRREVGNMMFVVKNTQRDALGNSDRLDKLERLLPNLISNIEALRRQVNTQSFGNFVFERSAMASRERPSMSRERTSIASRESRRGTPTNSGSTGLLDSEPRMGTPAGQTRISTPHPFVSQRGLGEGLDALRSDVRTWLETLRDSLMSHLKDKADSSQVHSLATQLAAAENELQVLPKCVESLGMLSQIYQETSPRESATFLAKRHGGTNYCASCDSPLSASAAEWRVVTPTITSLGKFPQRALPDLPRGQLGKGVMQKNTSLPMLHGPSRSLTASA